MTCFQIFFVTLYPNCGHKSFLEDIKTTTHRQAGLPRKRLFLVKFLRSPLRMAAIVTH